ncbi:MAG: carbon-nitrogen hydrolase family protein [Candidatus Hydrogenedentes bacterium]|nr:carbon-nitrogen hydrolase family protein [Candidatus Hydrogenedentota bacterium]
MRTIRVALIQFDAVPEQAERNVAKMEMLVRDAVRSGAQWVLFHEGTVCDYTPNLKQLAEPVPDGPSTSAMLRLAAELNCHIVFGLSECDHGRFYITQVFVGPRGLVYRYRKTWLWRQGDDTGYRNEWARYDPGNGPELFEFDGVRATCFICADGEAPRCVERAAQLRPELVFYPNNREQLPSFEDFGKRAKEIGAPMLVTNRVGLSWEHDCKGGNVVYGKDGGVLAKSNREGREEILVYDLPV